MIRKTLFNNVGRALRDSLNDVEAAALGLWLAQSAGLHIAGANQYKKDPAVLTALEDRLNGYLFKDKVVEKLGLEGVIDAGTVADGYHMEEANTRTQSQTVERIGSAVHLITLHVRESRGRQVELTADDEDEFIAETEDTTEARGWEAPEVRTAPAWTAEIALAPTGRVNIPPAPPIDWNNIAAPVDWNNNPFDPTVAEMQRLAVERIRQEAREIMEANRHTTDARPLTNPPRFR